MKAGIITGANRFVFEDVPEPEMRHGAAIVDILYCGICGSDVSAFKTGLPYPRGICGHEILGVVKDIDIEVPGVQVGARVVISASGPCGIECHECLQGHYASCTTIVKQLFGRDGYSPRSGGFAPRQLVNARRLVPVLEGLSDEQAAMVEPATVAAHSVRHSGVRAGDRVAVIGAGPIGLFAMQSLIASGVQEVAVVDPDDSRRKLALALGAHHAWSPGEEAATNSAKLADGIGFDQVYECSGHPSSLEAAALLARQQAMVVMPGFSTAPIPITSQSWVIKELRLMASLGYDKSDTIAVMRLMASGAIRTGEMYSGTIGLDQAGDMIEEMAAESSAVKVLVNTRI